MILNDVKIIGNLTADPQLRYTPKGTPVASIALGVNEPYETESGERRQVTTFVDVRVWGPSGQNLANLAKKGAELFIQGKLRQDRWEDADTGQTRTKLYVKADLWQFTQYRAPRPAPQPEPEPQQPAAEAPTPEAAAPEPAAPAAEPASTAPAPTAKRKVSKRAEPASA
jgi:single-strand DNA-binding protein